MISQPNSHYQVLEKPSEGRIGVVRKAEVTEQAVSLVLWTCALESDRMIAYV